MRLTSNLRGTCAALVLASATGAAHAAEYLPYGAQPYEGYVRRDTGVTWTGFYLGAAGGAALDSSKVTRLDEDLSFLGVKGGGPNGTSNFTSVFTTGGVFGGYNYQIGSVVLGAETDISIVDSSRRTGNKESTDLGFGISSIGGTKTHIDYYGTVRARLGYTVAPNLLLYGTGGLAYGQVASRGNLTVSDPFGDAIQYVGKNSEVKMGYAVGGGIEYAFAPQWLLRAEYLRIGLSDTKVDVVPVSATFTKDLSGLGGFTYRRDNHLDVIRAGFAYRF